MITFPNCKINLGLYVTEKRADGYHTIVTIFYPIALTDALEIITPLQQPQQPLQFTTTGLPINVSSSSNLCVKAYELLLKDFANQLKPIHMHLHKVIPMGAGLGGGSANGAFTLLQLNKLFNIGLTQQQLIQYALQLGSDCPFFIINQPCFATGRGERLEPIAIDVANYYIAIVNPGIHINTGWAFSKITPTKAPILLQEAILQPIQNWKNCIYNQFEAAAIAEHPIIGQVKETLYQNGAIYASMSGSGSTVYGFFKQKPSLFFNETFFTHIIEPANSTI